VGYLRANFCANWIAGCRENGFSFCIKNSWNLKLGASSEASSGEAPDASNSVALFSLIRIDGHEFRTAYSINTFYTCHTLYSQTVFQTFAIFGIVFVFYHMAFLAS
jgi:hypothetical protein